LPIKLERTRKLNVDILTCVNATVLHVLSITIIMTIITVFKIISESV